jgi:hypothetical protein
MNMRISPRYAPGPGRRARSSRRAGTVVLVAIALVLTALVMGFATPRATAATCGTTNTALHQPATALPTWPASNSCSDATGSICIKDPGPQTWTVGVPVSLQIQACDPGAGQSLYFSAVGLPAGLSISPAGLISGIPTTAGVGGATVHVVDTTGASGSLLFTWTVVNPQATG